MSESAATTTAAPIGGKSPEKDHYITAGITLFFVMSYILIANPLILSCAESKIAHCVAMPPGGVLLGTCATAGIFTIISGFATRTPAAIAPGMAFNIFFVQFMSQNGIHWSAGLILCGIAGAIVLLMTLVGLRYKIICAVPPPLARSVGGGIGALLAETAITYLHKPNSEDFDPLSVALFALGLLIICPLYFYGRSFAKKAPTLSSMTRQTIDTMGCASFVISILVIWWLAPHPKPIEGVIGYLWLSPFPIDGLKTLSNPAAISFVFFLVYMLTIDIVGSPYELVQHLARLSPEDKKRVSVRGFLIDSAANCFAPLFGTSPVVFFAESHSARLVGAKTGRASIIAGALFLAFGIAVFLLSRHGIPSMPPKSSIAPTLFIVGAVVVAETLRGEPGAKGEALGDVGSFFEEPTQLLDSLPAAVTIILTPMIGIQFGLAGGIVAFFLLAYLLPEDRRKEEIDDRPAFVGLAILAFLAIIVIGWVDLQHWWTSADIQINR